MQASTVLTNLEGLTCKQFTPQSATKYVPAFMKMLPELFAKQSVPIVDSEGFFDNGKRKMRWSEIAARTHGCFDVLLSGQSPAQYSKQVFGQFLAFLPQKDGSLKRLKLFVQKVDQLSAPWIPP